MNSHQLRVTPSITMSPEDNEKGRPLFPGGLKATVKVRLEWPQSVSRLRGRWGEVPADLASQETLKQFFLFIKKLQRWALCGTTSLCSAELRDFKSLSRATYVQNAANFWCLLVGGTRTAKLTMVTWSLTVWRQSASSCHVAMSPKRKDWFVWFVFQCVSF